jgi:hypothetical protein
VTLVRWLVTALRATKGDKDQALCSSLSKLHSLATEKCDKFIKNIYEAQNELSALNVDLGLPEAEAARRMAQSGGLVSRVRFRQVVAAVIQVRSEVGRLASDVEAILFCSQRSQALVDAARSAYTRKFLDQMSLKDGVSLKDLLREMVNVLQDIRQSLQ